VPDAIAKGRPVHFDNPGIEAPRDILKGLSAIVEAMAKGELAPDEASAVAAVIEAQRKAIETVELEERVRKLEEKA
jgi:hypothetical protein